jgi:hypothetical protein
MYKIITKSLADKIKNHLPDHVNQAQSAFIANRHISSNIIITHEIIHSFGLKTWKNQCFILKIDLAKAFNRIEWSFIIDVLHCMGFKNSFMNLIYTCISTSSRAILIKDGTSNLHIISILEGV